ncbi:MAG TPA: nitroreductase [Gemmatimonadales bacterium]|jgi:nitroreductase
MDTFDAIARRTSTRTFRAAPLPRHVIERLLASAVRAPNHKLTEPWRFAVLTGASKSRYAEIRAAWRAVKFEGQPDEQTKRADKARREALDTPAFVAVMCAESQDPVRREEDYGAVMMAVENLLVAAAADGIGSFLRTGGIMEQPEVRELVHLPAGYRMAGIISLGYLATEPEPTPRKKPLNEVVEWLE